MSNTDSRTSELSKGRAIRRLVHTTRNRPAAMVTRRAWCCGTRRDTLNATQEALDTGSNPIYSSYNLLSYCRRRLLWRRLAELVLRITAGAWGIISVLKAWSSTLVHTYCVRLIACHVPQVDPDEQSAKKMERQVLEPSEL